MKRLLDIKNLNIQFNEGDKTKEVLKDVSFNIDKGETLALVGESGSGKSVTGLSIAKLLPANARLSCKHVLFNGQDLSKKNHFQLEAIRGDDICYIFQEPMTSLNPLHRVGKQIVEIITKHQFCSEKNAYQKTLRLLDKVAIQDANNKIKAYPHELSGGQRQRIMIAMALANKPKLLIADEPTTALDVTVQMQILQLIKSIQQEDHMSMLFISHDLSVVTKMADRIAIMKDGRIIESSNKNTILNHAKESYTKALLNAEPEGTPKAVSCQESILSIKDLSVSYPIQRRFFGNNKQSLFALKNINLELNKSETLGIVGESGSGKTTLALALLRLMNNNFISGKVCFYNQTLDELNEKSLRQLRKNMQIVFQDPYGSLSPRMSILEIVAEGLHLHEKHLSKSEIKERVIEALQDVGLKESYINRYPHEFSGGQRQRIAIARMLVLKPKLAILDEPTSALDRSVQKQVIELLRSLQQKYEISFIFISHDLKVVRAISHKIAVIKNGEIIEQGPANQIFTQAKQAYTKELFQAALF